MRSMHMLVWLLLPLLPLCSQARTLTTEAVKTKDKVQTMAMQLLIKLENITIPTPLTTTLRENNNNYTICYVLQFLNISSNLIRGSFMGSSEIRSELDSLRGFVDQSTSCPCSSEKLTPPKALAGLQTKYKFSDSVIFTVYHQLKEYLKYQQKNLDKLEICF